MLDEATAIMCVAAVCTLCTLSVNFTAVACNIIQYNYTEC